MSSPLNGQRRPSSRLHPLSIRGLRVRREQGWPPHGVSCTRHNVIGAHKSQKYRHPCPQTHHTTGVMGDRLYLAHHRPLRHQAQQARPDGHVHRRCALHLLQRDERLHSPRASDGPEARHHLLLPHRAPDQPGRRCGAAVLHHAAQSRAAREGLQAGGGGGHRADQRLAVHHRPPHRRSGGWVGGQGRGADKSSQVKSFTAADSLFNQLRRTTGFPAANPCGRHLLRELRPARLGLLVQSHAGTYARSVESERASARARTGVDRSS